jgi:hypothetical protein
MKVKPRSMGCIPHCSSADSTGDEVTTATHQEQQAWAHRWTLHPVFIDLAHSLNPWSSPCTNHSLAFGPCYPIPVPTRHGRYKRASKGACGNPAPQCHSFGAKAQAGTGGASKGATHHAGIVQPPTNGAKPTAAPDKPRYYSFVISQGFELSNYLPNYIHT